MLPIYRFQERTFNYGQMVSSKFSEVAWLRSTNKMAPTWKTAWLSVNHNGRNTPRLNHKLTEILLCLMYALVSEKKASYGVRALLWYVYTHNVRLISDTCLSSCLAIVRHLQPSARSQLTKWHRATWDILGMHIGCACVSAAWFPCAICRHAGTGSLPLTMLNLLLHYIQLYVFPKLICKIWGVYRE